MAAELLAEDGQSLFEFLLSFPLMLALVATLIKVNTAMQLSIVNQQYARQHTLFIAFNHAHYPEDRFRSKATNRLDIGVSKNTINADDSVEPEATIYRVTRKPSLVGNNDPGEEPAERGRVRVRTNVSMCTASFWVSAGGGSPLWFRPPGGGSTYRSETVSETLLSDSAYEFCKGPRDE